MHGDIIVNQGIFLCLYVDLRFSQHLIIEEMAPVSVCDGGHLSIGQKDMKQ